MYYPDSLTLSRPHQQLPVSLGAQRQAGGIDSIFGFFSGLFGTKVCSLLVRELRS
jgi:hypothetical protein